MQINTLIGRALRLVTAAGLFAVLLIPSFANEERISLNGHIPADVGASEPIDRVQPGQQIPLAIALPLRNTADLDTLISRLYDPNDPLFGKFLTPEQFTEQFAPTEEQYQTAISYARSQGLTVTGVHANRTLLDLAAPSAVVEKAFGMHLLQYQKPDGSHFYAPDSEPSIPASMGGIISNIVGLDNAAVWHSHAQLLTADQAVLSPREIGTGPGGGMSPSDIRAAYNLNAVSQKGAGQTLALFELDGYTPSDISQYETRFGLPSVPLQNVLVDSYDGSAGTGAYEVTLDIELQIALACAAKKILVYEAPNYAEGVIDLYNKIATDDIAKEISTSWGCPEADLTPSAVSAENAAFIQMAAQGQSIFAASGDYGAYDNGSTLSVDDPAAQPYVTGVGGTSLRTTVDGGSWSSESTWAYSGEAGGGGVSALWSIPSYQTGLYTAASLGSATKRNVPDVSLNADPGRGYAIFFKNSWYLYGGTSCSAPLWSAFAALVNQGRATNGSVPIGFMNPSLYSIAKGTHYMSDFHDIADGRTNLYYPAVAGYDDATGLGSFNGANLMADLGGAEAADIPAVPTGLTATAGNSRVVLSWGSSAGASTYNLYRATTSGGEGATPFKLGVTGTAFTDTGLTNGTAYYYEVAAVNRSGVSGKSNEAAGTPFVQSTGGTQLLGDPGFENGGGNIAPWAMTPGVINNSASELAHSGTWKARLCGYGVCHFDALRQTVAIPAGIHTATLSFYLHIDTAETTITAANDTLCVMIRNSSNTPLQRLAAYSNLNAASGYTLKSFDLSAYKGKTIQIYLYGVENSSRQTSFVVDDFSLIAN